MQATQETGVPSLGQEDLEEGIGSPPQLSCLENPVERGAWQTAVHGGHKESDMPEATQHA